MCGDGARQMKRQRRHGQHFPRTTGGAALFVAPSLAVIAAVLFYPLLRGIGMGFTDRIFGFRRYSFVGLENYQQMLADPLFWHSLGNSLRLTALNVVFMIALGLGLALLLNSRAWFKGLFKPLLFVPWAMPSMVIVLMFRWLYNDMYGWPNYALTTAGIIEEPVNLLAETDGAWVAILIPLVWSFYPFVMVVLLSTLQSIDKSLYEAAAIDGAGAWQSFRTVTWPALRPVILILVALESIWSFATFDLVYLLTKGGPADSTATLSLYVYKQGFVSHYLGYASALGTVMFLVLACFTALYLWALRRRRLYGEAT
jgi:multiple sugar transport system permease protein